MHPAPTHTQNIMLTLLACLSLGISYAESTADKTHYVAGSVKDMETVELDVSADGEDGLDFRALNMDPTSVQPKAPVRKTVPKTKTPQSLSIDDVMADSPSVTEPQEPSALELDTLTVNPLPKRPEKTLDNADFAPLEAKAVVVDIVSDTLNYDTNTKLYTATGSVHVIISEQNTELTANKVVYDKDTELMIAEGDVVINNKGEKTYGTYAKIDLTRKSALINDPIAKLEQVRIKAREGLVGDNDYVELYNGKLVVPATIVANTPQLQARRDDAINELTDGDLSRLAVVRPLEAPDKPGKSNPNAPTYENKLVAQELDMSWDIPETGHRSKFRLHSKDVEIVRGEDGVNDINLLNPKLKYGDFTLATLPQMDFMHDETQNWTEYLGPDIGVDPDLGGLYAGPGWDFRAGKGIVKVSPLASFGVGARRTRGGRKLDRSTGAGVGLFLNYMSPNTRSWFAYSTQTETPIFMFDRKILDGKTHVMAAANEDYTLGFIGWERPKYIGQVYDNRKLYGNDWFRVDSYASAGVAKDEFFPNSNDNFFVKPEDNAEPGIAGRIQFQAQARNVKPLLRLGSEVNHVDFGWASQLGLAAYTTGDLVGVWKNGPSATFQLGNRFQSINRYFYAFTSGDSPFIFDQYYRGRNNVQSVNQVRVNKYLTLGLRSNMALEKDNAQGALFTGNAFFMLVGPEDVKFNIAYDFVRQRSYFGLNIMPGGKRKTLHYDRLQMYQPTDYGLMSQNTAATANPLANQNVGMMDGMKAR